MDVKIKFILCFFAFSLLSPAPVFAQIASSSANNLTTSTTTPSSLATTTQGSILGVQAPKVPPILAAIKAAKAQLNGVDLNHALAPVYKNVKNKKTGKTTKTLTGYNLNSKDIALAILDPQTQNIITTVGMQTGTTMTFNDSAVDVQLAKFNGVNSQFQVNRPAGGAVIALKYLISKYDSGSKKTIEGGLSPSLYVPYSDQINSPEVVAYGANYLDGVVKQAAAQLKYLPSHAIPGKALTEAIPPAMIKALIYAEHTESATVMSGNVKNAFDQLNILFATNEGDAYKYSVSNDGYASRGISQFVKSTYDSLVARHPEAGLNADYVTAMADHVTSIKAMYLLMDDYAGDVRIKGAQGFAEGHIFEYGAASYNAGVTRVANAVKNFGPSWDQDRSDQIDSLQSEVNSLASQVKNLKAKIKKTSDKKQKSSLNSQLATAQSQLTDENNQLDTLKASSLKSGTVNYLNKVYRVTQYFNDQQI